MAGFEEWIPGNITCVNGALRVKINNKSLEERLAKDDC